MTNIECIDAIVQEILNTCGGQKFLHVNSGDGQLVQKLLANGVDAYGFDNSFKAIIKANDLMPGRFMQSDLKKLPYADKTFDTVIIIYSLDHFNYQEITQAIKELKRITRRSIYLRVKTIYLQENNLNKNILDRNDWELLFFNENFRKHPSYYLINDYNTLDRESGEAIILLERIPYLADKYYPLKVLKERRDLHMDMTRETGKRSDAHMARYQWATNFVRPGDTVLDAACGLGYGSYILQCSTMAAKTTGIDNSDFAIDYANINFSPYLHNLSFSFGNLPGALNKISSNSVDVVVSFETLEHISNPENVLKEFHRILTPAGRIIISVPNDWSDETGKDPNPFHLHVYTLNKIRNQINMLFDLESIIAQSATRYKKAVGDKKWTTAKRELYEIDTNIDEISAPQSEWWIIVGMKSFLNAENIIYRETQHKTFSQPKWNVTTFSRDYKNPWLIRGMVDVGWRQKNKILLSKLAEEVINTKFNNIADIGAALCVKGYQLLDAKQTTSVDILTKYAEQIDKYVDNNSENPHQIRWMISLHFVVARLWLQSGMHEKAYTSLIKCVEIDFLKFSPLLANRVVEAYLYLGKLSLNSGNESAARAAWTSGILIAKRAVTADWQLSLGDLNSPAEFALPELSSILDHASNCAYALANLSDFKDKPWWWLQLQRSPHAQFASKKIQYNLLSTQIISLNNFINSLQNIIQDQKNKLFEQANKIKIKKKELRYTTNILNSINIVIFEYVIKFCRLYRAIKTHFVRFLNIIIYRSYRAFKAADIAHRITIFVNTHFLYKKLQLVTNCLCNHFFRLFLPIKNVDNLSTSNVYQVRKPESKKGAPKIVHIIANFMIGGSSRLVIDLIEYLGHEYKQFILTSYIPDPPDYVGLDIEEQRTSRNVTPFVNYLKRKKPNFIQVHYWGDIDKLWYSQAIEAAKILGIPVIENINTPVAPYISDIVKQYVYVSDYVRHVFGRSDATHITIYPGSDFSHFLRTDNEIIPSNCVGMVYRLEYDKLNKDSIKPLILIAQKRPNTTVLIVGGGSLFSIFQREVKKAGVESNFEFTGYVSYDNLPSYYRRMSLFIAPVWKESFGQVSSFAMNMRIPVIGYDTGAISEIVNLKGMLAPKGDAEKLSNIAIKLLNNDELRVKIGIEHQRRAEEKFSVQVMIEAYAKIYAKMTKK